MVYLKLPMNTANLRPSAFTSQTLSQLHWSDGSILFSDSRNQIECNAKSGIITEVKKIELKLWLNFQYVDSIFTCWSLLQVWSGIWMDTLSCSQLLVIFPLTTFPKLRTKWRSATVPSANFASFVMSSAIFGLHLGGFRCEKTCRRRKRTLDLESLLFLNELGKLR